jgi:hypothetical protein
MQRLAPGGRAGRKNQLGPVQRITVNLPVKDYRLLLMMAEVTGREMSEIVRTALRKDLGVFLTSEATSSRQDATNGDGEDAA